MDQKLPIRPWTFCLLEPDLLTFTWPKHIGVSQGSILGPLLFLTYIIVNSSNILSFVLFAEDTTVYIQHDSIDGAIQILNSEFDKVAEWFDSNKLTLNVNKTQMLMMSRKKNMNPQGDVILHNEAIQRVTKAKFLGVIVDQHLNWKDHISMVSHKISKSCIIISRIRNSLAIKSKNMIYYSLIHPYLTYGIYVFKTLCTAQKRSVRTLFATAQQPHSRDIFIIKKFCLWINWLINKKVYLLTR